MATILQFVRHNTRPDEQKYSEAVALQTGIEQKDPRCDTHWRITIEREFWPSHENPTFYEFEGDAESVATRIDKTLGGVVDVIPPGWALPI